MYSSIRLTTVAGFLLLQLSACGDKNSADELAIAKVDGKPVYASDFDVVKARVLGNVPAKYIDKNAEDKLLNSLLRSRAMSQLMQKEIAKDSAGDIEAQVKAFRDDLYVKAYVEKHGKLAKVTNESVKQYYMENQGSFGGASKKSLETIKVDFAGAKKVQDKNLQGAGSQEQVLKKLSDLKVNKNWKSSVEKLKAKGINAVYQKQTINEKFLKSPLQEVVKKMNNKSEPQLISGDETYLVRVIGVQQVPAKPFNQVSGEIRKLLQRQSYRKAVETLSDQVMQQVTVEIK